MTTLGLIFLFFMLMAGVVGFMDLVLMITIWFMDR